MIGKARALSEEAAMNAVFWIITIHHTVVLYNENVRAHIFDFILRIVPFETKRESS